MQKKKLPKGCRTCKENKTCVLLKRQNVLGCGFRRKEMSITEQKAVDLGIKKRRKDNGFGGSS